METVLGERGRGWRSRGAAPTWPVGKGAIPSVLEPKFVKWVIQIFAVIPAKAGVQKSFKFLDSGSRYPGLWSGVGRNDTRIIQRTSEPTH